MVYTNSILLENKTNEFHSYSISQRRTEIKKKLVQSIEYTLTGLMLKTYMTMSYLWLYAHKFQLLRKRLKSQQNIIPQHQGFLKHA